MKSISWWRTEVGEAEIERVVASIRAEKISQGSVTAEFEKRISEMLGIKYVVACTSGTTALLMAYIAAGIRRDDEVIIPNRTWIATAHAAQMAGAKVVLADDDPYRKEVFVNEVRKKITSKTKAIVPVHLGGRAVDMPSLQAIAQEHGCLIIEDAAQAFLSKNEQGYLGTQSVAGCFSLSLAKLISTGQGGFVITSDSGIYEKLLCMRNHGVSDPVHVTYTQFGFNFRFNDVLSSIGLGQLDRAENRVQYVTKLYHYYRKALSPFPFLQFIPVNLAQGEVPLYIEVLCQDRARLVAYLQENKVQTRPYYPNVNLAPQLRDDSAFPHAAEYGERGLFLPCGPSQPIENVDRVIELLQRFERR